MVGGVFYNIDLPSAQRLNEDCVSDLLFIFRVIVPFKAGCSTPSYCKLTTKLPKA